MFSLLITVSLLLRLASASESIHSIALQETPSPGFFVDAEYTDEACTSITSAFVHPLNSCTFDGEKYFFATANSTTTLKKFYVDSACKTFSETEVVKLTGCISKEKHYVQSTSKVTSSQSIVTTR
jgi:hypothetical protein